MDSSTIVFGGGEGKDFKSYSPLRPKVNAAVMVVMVLVFVGIDSVRPTQSQSSKPMHALKKDDIGPSPNPVTSALTTASRNECPSSKCSSHVSSRASDEESRGKRLTAPKLRGRPTSTVQEFR